MNAKEILRKEELKKIGIEVVDTPNLKEIIIKPKKINYKPWFFDDNGKAIPFNQSRCSKYLKDTYNIIYFGDFYKFDGISYIKISKEDIVKIMTYELNIEVSNTNVKNTIELLSSISAIDESLINKDKSIIVFKNCAIRIDRKTKQIKEVKLTSNDYYIHRLNVDYNSNDTTIYNFKQYLNTSLPEIQQQKLLQEFCGICLYKEMELKKFLQLYGKKDTGKSILLEILEYIFNGHYTNFEINELDERFNKIFMKDSLLNVCGELIQNIENSLTLKKILGRDSIQGEHKGMKGVTFKSYTRFVFATNKMLRLCGDKTDGMYERLLFIHFKNSVHVDKQIKGLANILIKNELSGIVNWMIEGLIRYLKNNKLTNTFEQEYLLNEQKALDSTIVKFVNDECKIESKQKMYQDMLFEKFREYCVRNNFKLNTTMTTFREELLKYFPDINDNDGKRGRVKSSDNPKLIYMGIRLLTSNDLIVDENKDELFTNDVNFDKEFTCRNLTQLKNLREKLDRIIESKERYNDRSDLINFFEPHNKILESFPDYNKLKQSVINNCYIDFKTNFETEKNKNKDINDIDIILYLLDTLLTNNKKDTIMAANQVSN
jgi:P4 family phage/plasmid primase-like protien